MDSQSGFALSCGINLYLEDSTESRFKCITFINVCLGALAHGALPVCVHYASGLVCKLVFREKPRPAAGPQVFSHSEAPRQRL